MKVAISAEGQNLEAQVDPHFGRCAYFVIVDPETLEFEAIANKGAASGGGAGIAAAQQIVDKGLKVVLTGSCGPNALNVLAAANVQVFTGASDNIKDTIDSYKEGKLQSVPQSNASAHS